MGKLSRKRMRIAASATVLLSSLFPDTPGPVASAASFSIVTNDILASTTALTTVFSCGSQWTKAKACTTLCPSGDDDACPPGQYCYAGMPCATPTRWGEAIGDAESWQGSENAMVMKGPLERQRHLERREMNRLAMSREAKYIDRFVCGHSYEEAEESCGPSSGGGDSAGDVVLGAAAARFCPAGVSSQCPAGMECYAAVPCPRGAHEERPALLVEQVSLRPSSSPVTEPMLVNSTLASAHASDGNGSAGEGGLTGEDHAGLVGEWSSFLIDSSLYLGRRVSTLLSSHYGVN